MTFHLENLPQRTQKILTQSDQIQKPTLKKIPKQFFINFFNILNILKITDKDEIAVIMSIMHMLVSVGVVRAIFWHAVYLTKKNICVYFIIYDKWLNFWLDDKILRMYSSDSRVQLYKLDIGLDPDKMRRYGHSRLLQSSRVYIFPWCISKANVI